MKCPNCGGNGFANKAQSKYGPEDDWWWYPFCTCPECGKDTLISWDEYKEEHGIK